MFKPTAEATTAAAHNAPAPAREAGASGSNAAGTTPMVLELRDVSKVYRTEKLETLALNSVYLSLRKGEFVAIEGPSGSGKTTLLSVLGLLDEPTTGHYALQGKSVQGLTARERARLRNQQIGFVFQDFNLIGDLTVADNVELPLVYGSLPIAERGSRVDEALQKVGMSHRRDHFPSQLSGGQQQRVAVARAIVSRPNLLLADEPTGNLDSKNGRAIMDLLLELHSNGSTVCMVSHNPEFSSLAQRVLVLKDGQIVSENCLGVDSK